MSNITENTAALGAAEQETEEESLVLKFRKPYKFEGQEYTEVDLSGMEDMTAGDLCAVAKLANRELGVTPIPEMTLPYAMYMAARASHKPVEFFKGMPPVEAMKLKNLVTGFLYGGDGVALSLRLHSGVDYFLGLPLDDLNDMAKVVLEIGKKQGHGTGHKNRRKGR